MAAAFLPARARPVDARSNCARSQGERLACSQRSAGLTIGSRRPSKLSASSATAGSASAVVSAGRGPANSRPAASSGSVATPSVPQTMHSAASGSPIANTIGGLPAGWGVNSGTIRVTRRPAASSACTAARNQMRLQAATQTGTATRAPGSRAK